MHNHPRTARLYGLGESELRHVRSRWVSRFKWGKNTKGRTTLLCVRTSPQYDNEAVIPVRLRPGIWGWLPHWLSDVRILQSNSYCYRRSQLNEWNWLGDHNLEWQKVCLILQDLQPPILLLLKRPTVVVKSMTAR